MDPSQAPVKYKNGQNDYTFAKNESVSGDPYDLSREALGLKKRSIRREAIFNAFDRIARLFTPHKFIVIDQPNLGWWEKRRIIDKVAGFTLFKRVKYITREEALNLAKQGKLNGQRVFDIFYQTSEGTNFTMTLHMPLFEASLGGKNFKYCLAIPSSEVVGSRTHLITSGQLYVYKKQLYDLSPEEKRYRRRAREKLMHGVEPKYRNYK